MIVIKSIDFFEVQGERHEFYNRYIKGGNPIMTVDTAAGTDQVMVEEVAELIKGREFRSPGGRSVVIGVSNQAQDIIGIQYEAWENQSRMIEELSRDNGQLTIKADQLHRQNEEKLFELNEIKAASIWVRLRWLFFGYKTA